MEGRILKTSTHRLALALLLTIAAGFSAASFAQKKGAAAPANAEPDPLSRLPQSDAVALVRVNRLVNEVLPQMLAANPAKLAEANAEIDKFKTRTGIDPRAFDQVAFGMLYTYPSANVTKVETVAVARGTFTSGAIVTAGRLAAAGKYRAETYQGRTIYVFTLGEQVKLFGLMNLKINELAISALDANNLALGNPNGVRRVIAAGKDRRGLNQELIALATQDPNAVVAFGGNVTPRLIQNLNLSNEAIVKDISSIRQVYGTLGITAKDAQIFLAARTVDAAAAKSLSGTIEGLTELAGLFVGRLKPAQGNLAKAALANLKITTQGNELRIRTSVTQADIGPLLSGK